MKVLLKQRYQIDWNKYSGYNPKYFEAMFGKAWEAEKEKFGYTIIDNLGIQVYIPGAWIEGEVR